MNSLRHPPPQGLRVVPPDTPAYAGEQVVRMPSSRRQIDLTNQTANKGIIQSISLNKTNVCDNEQIDTIKETLINIISDMNFRYKDGFIYVFFNTYNSTNYYIKIGMDEITVQTGSGLRGEMSRLFKSLFGKKTMRTGPPIIIGTGAELLNIRGNGEQKNVSNLCIDFCINKIKPVLKFIIIEKIRENKYTTLTKIAENIGSIKSRIIGIIRESIDKILDQKAGHRKLKNTKKRKLKTKRRNARVKHKVKTKRRNAMVKHKVKTKRQK